MSTSDPAAAAAPTPAAGRAPAAAPTPAARRAASRQRTAWTVGIVVAIVVAVGGYVLLSGRTSDSTGAGFLTGGLAVVALAGVGRWRSVQRSDRAGTASRIGGGTPDERDRRVLEATFAVAGVVALFATSVASGAALMGADAERLLTALPMLLIGTVVVTFVVTNRRS